MSYAEHEEHLHKENVPNLRFPEFSGEWTKTTLGKIGETFNGLTGKSGSDFGQGSPYITYKSIFDNSKIDLSRVEYVTITDAERKKQTQNEVHYGDIFFTTSSETPDEVGMTSVLLDEVKDCYLNSFCFGYRLNSITDVLPEYMRFYLRSNTIRRRLFVLAQGSTRFNISKGEVMGLTIKLPGTAEQRKIAQLLTMIEDRIATQIKIIEDLKKLKSAISNKYLYDKSWPKYKISEIATLGRGRVISSKEIGLQRNPMYPVYSSQTSNDGVMGYLDTYDFDGEYITWTTDGANAGTVFYRNGQFNCTNVCGTIKVGESFDAYFLSTILQTATARYVSTNLANPKLMNNTMASIVVRIPDIKIQKYWSSILRKMEEKLSIEATILLALQQQKQYFLAQMFI